MRWFTPIAAIAVLCACPPAAPPNPAPPGNPALPNQFYFPTGLAYVDSPFDDGGTRDGTLFVASGNFDRRYDRGAVTAVDLSRIGLPAFNSPLAATGPVQLSELKLRPGAVAQIASFAGELGLLKTPTGVRLFVPTRSENNYLFVLDSPSPATATDSPVLQCFISRAPDAGRPNVSDAGLPIDCSPTGQSLTALDQTESGIPRAPSPIGIGIGASGQVWVTSSQQADSPRLSLMNPVGYLVRLDGLDPEVTAASFVSIGPGASSSVAVGQRFAYATGRLYLANSPAYLVRVVDTRDAGLGSDGGQAPSNVFSPGLESQYTVFEGRGVAVSSDETRLYFVGRSPDTLVVASIADKQANSPSLNVEHAVPLPEGADLVVTIPRPGRSDLVAIACSTAGVLAFYDDDVGDLVAQVSGVGLQPYAVAVDLKSTAAGLNTGARLYVSNFTDGRVAVIDIPDLNEPKTAQIVAFIGKSQLCLTRGTRDTSQPDCDGGTR